VALRKKAKKEEYFAVGEKQPYFCIVKTNKTYDNENNKQNEDSEILPQGGKTFRSRSRRN
jgi:hypothetical protein